MKTKDETLYHVKKRQDDFSLKDATKITSKSKFEEKR